ncbi:hypothetical protein TSMEX_000549 [Taenia solium]|eukprot:TsM_000530800 transcript=TsM_000530800 gene=TsM_000530800
MTMDVVAGNSLQFLRLLWKRADIAELYVDCERLSASAFADDSEGMKTMVLACPPPLAIGWSVARSSKGTRPHAMPNAIAAVASLLDVKQQSSSPDPRSRESTVPTSRPPSRKTNSYSPALVSTFKGEWMPHEGLFVYSNTSIPMHIHFEDPSPRGGIPTSGPTFPPLLSHFAPYPSTTPTEAKANISLFSKLATIVDSVIRDSDNTLLQSSSSAAGARLPCREEVRTTRAWTRDEGFLEAEER